MFPKNCWYVAAIASELAPSSVLSRVICEYPVALYRDQAGKVAALLDRCPHRLYPLSAGTVTDRGLQCGYHGLIFAGNGRCVDIPSQSEIPVNACVRSFPLCEAHGFIWLWPGDPAAADEALLPAFATGPGYQRGLDFSCLTDLAHWGVAGPEVIHIDANYMLAVDNLLDLTHTAFVHKATFDNGAVLTSERSIKTVDDQVHDFFAIKGHLSKPLQGAYQLGDALHDNFLETYWAPPGIMILVHGATEHGGVREDGAVVLNTNIITPATASTCHYFWAQSVWANKGDGTVRDTWGALTKIAFAEDEHTLRTQQANLRRFGCEELGDDVSLVLKADRAIILARRIVARKIREEGDHTAIAA